MTSSRTDHELYFRRISLLTGLGWIALPWLQLIPVDFERGALLVAFLPALLAGFGITLREWSRWWAYRPLRVLLIVGLLVLGGATIAADHPAPALTQTAQILLLSWLALHVSGLVREAPETRRLLVGGLLLGALSGVLSLLIAWMLHADPHHKRPDLLLGFYPHPRHIGLHLLPAAAILPALTITSTSRAGRLSLLTISSVLMAALVWSGGRMPLVGLATAAVFGTWIVRKSPLTNRLLIAYLLPFLAGLVLSTFFWTDSGGFGWWRSAATVINADNLNELSSRRLDIWHACIGFMPDHLLLGRGPDAYRFLLPKMDGQQPHNLVVQVLLSAGIPGLLWCMTTTGWLLWRRRSATSAPPLSDMLPPLLAFVALLAGGLFDGTLYHVLSTSGLALCVGLLIATAPLPASQTRPSAARGFPPSALATGTLLIFALHFFVFYRLSPERQPPPPTSLAARVVHAFPSTTIGLDQWLNAWNQTQPEIALAWARWAQAHSAYGWNYHAWAARHLAEQGRIQEAREEAERYQATRPDAFRERLVEQTSDSKFQPGFAPDNTRSHH